MNVKEILIEQIQKCSNEQVLDLVLKIILQNP